MDSPKPSEEIRLVHHPDEDDRVGSPRGHPFGPEPAAPGLTDGPLDLQAVEESPVPVLSC